MTEADEALSLLRAGAPDDIKRAVALLDASADAGEVEAPRRLAALAAAGVGMHQSWPRALDLLLQAALAGSPSARGQLQVLAGDNAGDPEACRAAIRIEDWIAPCEKRVLSSSPRIVAIDRFLSRAVSDWLAGLAVGRLALAKVYGPSDDAPVLSERRGNTAFEFEFIDCDVVTLLTRMRIAATIGAPVAALESAQVLHYAVGEAFAPHHDYLYLTDPGRPAEIAARGQRMATFLIYLNDGFEGGETHFPYLGVRHRGDAGGALYFANLAADGAGDPRTLHAGLAPTSGEKWLFSQWVRNRAVM